MKLKKEKVDETLQATRSRMNHLVQAYREAPWRTQRKWIVLFLLGTVAVGMVTGIYLDVTSRAALAGREVQVLEADIADHQRENADLETKLAESLSTSRMLERATAMGFVPATPDDVDFMAIPGYFPPPAVVMASGAALGPSPALDPRFTQSLFGWFDEQLQNASAH